MPFEFPKEISRTSLDGLWNDVWRIVEQLRLWEDRLGEGSAVSVKIDESAARKQDEIMRALAAVKNAPANLSCHALESFISAPRPAVSESWLK